MKEEIKIHQLKGKTKNLFNNKTSWNWKELKRSVFSFKLPHIKVWDLFEEYICFGCGTKECKLQDKI